MSKETPNSLALFTLVTQLMCVKTNYISPLFIIGHWKHNALLLYFHIFSFIMCSM